jgi:putative flippase GtrA
MTMAERVSRIRHFGGFVLAGVVAMAVDAGTLVILSRFLGMSPFIARPVGILFAMIVSWVINRWIAFAVEASPTWSEFAKFAVASSASITVNYLVFAAILLAVPATPPVVAIVIASMVSMFVSYAGFRFGAFRSPSRKS